MRPVIIGTAGHIDHGKTALVRALTGTNTDRLKEEQARGITIDLGYAFLAERVAIIDVPGHERFIKNMVAGVATVDFALLVVAADDGVMPQTREHFDILRLLGIEDGIVAITKCDLADEDWIDMVEEEIRGLAAGSFLDGRPVIRVDSLSGRGIEDVRRALLDLASRQQDRPAGAVFRLPIDRVFTIKGFGTVVTGSALSGVVAVEDKLELLPRGDLVRVRGIESQGRSERTASAGMRVALNVTPLAVEDVERGDVLATPGRLQPTFMLDAECRILEGSPVALEQRQRVRVHLGTKEVLARAVIIDRDRIEPGQEGLVQLRLEERTTAQRLDRYVIRRYSPQLTIGGGRVLDAAPRKYRRRHAEEAASTLRQLGDSRDEQVLLRVLDKARVLGFAELVTRTNLPAERVEELVGILGVDGELIELEARGERHLLGGRLFADFSTEVSAALAEYHKKNPLKVGAKRGEILARYKKELPDFALRHLVDLAVAGGVVDAPGGDLLAAHGFEVQLTKKQREALAGFERSLREGRFQPPDLTALAEDTGLDEKAARQLVQVLVDRELAINLEGKIYFHTQVVAEGIEILRREFEKRPELTMSELRQAVDTSRKYALPLFNYCDSQGLTTRKGDVRVAGPRLNRP
jgi:selenocysteine-specific elongation factor